MYSIEAEKRRINTKKTDVNLLIAICEIKDDYKYFIEELDKLMKSEEENLNMKMFKIMNDKFTLGNYELKRLFYKYRNVINIIKKYNCVEYFTIYRYDEYGNVVKKTEEEKFYEYLMRHESFEEKIKSNLRKIKKLGFKNVYFNEKLDFSKWEYSFRINNCDSFCYLDNIEIIPTYTKGDIKYKTNDSFYCIVLGKSGYRESVLSNYSKDIELNSLIYDERELPDEITIDNTYNFIIKMYEEKKSVFKNINNSIEIGADIKSLKEQSDYYYRSIITKIENANNKEEMVKILNEIKKNINELNEQYEIYNNQLVEENIDISHEVLIREREKQIRIREFNSIHWN